MLFQKLSFVCEGFFYKSSTGLYCLLSLVYAAWFPLLYLGCACLIVIMCFAEMAEMLMQELENRFPSSDILTAFGILYPQYWLQEGAEEAFPKHLQVLKRQYCGTREQRAHGARELPKLTCGELLSSSALDIQQSLFKVTMKAQAKGCVLPPFDKNPFTRLWDLVSSSAVLTKMIPKYLKLAEIGCAFMLGVV